MHASRWRRSCSRRNLLQNRLWSPSFSPHRPRSGVSIVARRSLIVVLLLQALLTSLAFAPCSSSANRRSPANSDRPLSMRALALRHHLRHNRPTASTFHAVPSFRRLDAGHRTRSPPPPSAMTKSFPSPHSSGATSFSRLSRRPRAVSFPGSSSARMCSSPPTDDAGPEHGGENRVASPTERLAERVVGGGDERRPLEPIRAVMAVSGGGSGAASTLASVPGASSILLESILAYDRRSYAEFVSAHLRDDGEEAESWYRDGGSVSWSFAGGGDEGRGVMMRQETSVAGGESGGGKEGAFKFCSAEAAILLSRAALQRSMELSPSFLDRSLLCVGVGSSSCLVGQDPKPGRRSRAYVALSSMREGTVLWEVKFSAEDDGDTEGEIESADLTTKRRTRSQEDAVTADLVLLSMLRHRERSLLASASASASAVDSSWNVGGASHQSILGQILDRDGDEIVERRCDGGREGNTKIDDRSPAAGARLIVDGKADVVAILPVIPCRSTAGAGGDTTHTTRPRPESTMEALFSDSGIPVSRGNGEGICGGDVLVVPGSFNPPHDGHVGLANAAFSAWRRRKGKQRRAAGEGALDRVWEATNVESDKATPTVWFEMSVTNVDKPPMNPDEAGRRVDLFLNMSTASASDGTATATPMPEDWAVVLTNAPLFQQKASVLAEVLRSDAEDPGGDNRHSRPSITFVLGADTMVRIIDPKYYGNSQDNMVAALIEMKEKGVHFIVGGRVSQGKGNGTMFVSGQEEINALPSHAKEMFTILEEKDFRMDVSSTELRKKSGFGAL